MATPQFAASLVSLFLLGTLAADAQEYPQRLGDIADFLLPEERETALAKSAVPAHLSDGAAIWLLTPTGYQQSASGSNGFQCLVQRGWSSPFVIEDVFFDPRLVAPICFNEEAAKTAMVEYFRRTELVLQGMAREEVAKQVLAEMGGGTIPLPSRTAVAYMLSPQQWIGSQVERWMPHVMVYGPQLRQGDIGANGLDSGMPLVFEHNGGPMATIVIPVPRWSDGTPAIGRH